MEPRFVPFFTAFARDERPESRAKRPKTTLGPKGGDRDAPCISIRILLHIWPPEGLRVEPQPNFVKLSCVLLIGLRVGAPWEGPGATKARAKGPLGEFRGTPSWLENAAQPARAICRQGHAFRGLPGWICRQGHAFRRADEQPDRFYRSWLARLASNMAPIWGRLWVPCEIAFGPFWALWGLWKGSWGSLPGFGDKIV